MELWIPITISAAFLQNVRSVLQKQLQRDLGTRGATYVRFVYGLPIAFVYLWTILLWRDEDLPAFGIDFVAYTVTGGLAQILATAALLASFRTRNFAAGVAYAKTEPIQAAIIGFLLLGDRISLVGLLAILLGLVAVLVLTLGSDIARWEFWIHGLRDRAARFGLAAGSLFGLAAICYRGAGLSLVGGDFVLRSAFTLAFTLVVQTVAMTVEMAWAEREGFGRVVRHWRRGVWVGLVAVGASAGWFAASLLQNAAYVRALGQVELLFAAASSLFFFHERLQGREITGMLLLAVSLLLLLAV